MKCVFSLKGAKISKNYYLLCVSNMEIIEVTWIERKLSFSKRQWARRDQSENHISLDTSFWSRKFLVIIAIKYWHKLQWRPINNNKPSNTNILSKCSIQKVTTPNFVAFFSQPQQRHTNMRNYTLELEQSRVFFGKNTVCHLFRHLGDAIKCLFPLNDVSLKRAFDTIRRSSEFCSTRLW